MLFIVDANGVPSVARMVSVQGNCARRPSRSPSRPTARPSPRPATIGLAATASDSDGTVAKVEFFNGATKLGEDTTAPYTLHLERRAGRARYTLTARATDNLGATHDERAGDDHGHRGANTPPTAAITSPADGATFAWKPTITITATASDTDGSVTRVEFRDGSTVLGQDTTAPYSYTWRNVPQGSHTLTVRATDNAGAVTTSAAVNITVDRSAESRD